MKNIKKINFNENENKKSISIQSARRNINSNDNKSPNNAKDIKKSVNKDNNSQKKNKKEKELIGDSYINLRKKRTKYSDINRIISLKCIRFINNSEINNLKKVNNNKCNVNETIKKNNNNKNKNNHSASHNNLNNNNNLKYNCKIGNLFKPIVENKIRGSYKEASQKRKHCELLSSLGKQSKNKNKLNKNYSSNKNKGNNNDFNRNIRIKNKYNGIYDSNIKKEKNYKIDLINNINNRQMDEEELVNVEFDENKTNENKSQNSLTKYSIYILSKYYNYEKIGISKIALYDVNKNLIPIEFSNTSDNIKVNYLFDVNPQYSHLSDKINDSYNIPLIADSKQNYIINFYINDIYKPFFDSIYIYNYSDVINGISPVKEIEIIKEKEILYKGSLELNNPNIIKISNCTVKKGDKNKLNNNYIINNEKNNKLIKNNGKSLTFTIFKSLVNENLDTNDNNNFRISKYDSARTFHTNRYSEECYINNYNDNNNINKISNSNLNNFENNNDNETDNQNNLLFFQTNYKFPSNFSNTIKYFSKTNQSNCNCFGKDFIINFRNENEYNFSKTVKQNNSNKLFLNSYNSAFDDCENLFRTSFNYMNKPDEFENYNNDNNIISNNYNNNNYICDNNNNEANYIEFKNIMIHLSSNYGHRKYIGLTGIIFIDDQN